MRKFLAASLVLGFCFFLLVNTSGQQSEQELRALVPKIVASWETFDLTKIEPYYAADADLTYFDLAPLKYNNWAEYRAGAQKGLFDPNSSIKAKMNDDLRVHSSGKFAWATFTFGADITSKQGATTHLDARWTMVFENARKAGSSCTSTSLRLWVVVLRASGLLLPRASCWRLLAWAAARRETRRTAGY